MFRYITMAVVLCTVSALSADTGSKIDSHVKVALLPVKQDNMPEGRGITDERLSAALHMEFTRATDFELVESSELDEQLQNEIVEDALFELLVTETNPNDPNSNVSNRRSGRPVLNLGHSHIRACFEFRYSDFEFCCLCDFRG